MELYGVYPYEGGLRICQRRHDGEIFVWISPQWTFLGDGSIIDENGYINWKKKEFKKELDKVMKREIESTSKEPALYVPEGPIQQGAQFEQTQYTEQPEWYQQPVSAQQRVNPQQEAADVIWPEWLVDGVLDDEPLTGEAQTVAGPLSSLEGSGVTPIIQPLDTSPLENVFLQTSEELEPSPYGYTEEEGDSLFQYAC